MFAFRVTLTIVAALWLLPAGEAFAQSGDEIDMLNREIERLNRDGKVADAILPSEKALRLAEQRFPPDDIALLPFLDKLASLYKLATRYEESEQLYLRAIAIAEKAKGSDHPDLIATLSNLADLYTFSGRNQHARAEPIYRRMLAITEQIKGADHPDLILFLDRLGFVLQVLGRFDEAEGIRHRALAILEKAHGPDSPAIIVALEKLASAYTSFGQKQYEKAEPLHRRSLAILEQAKGAEHPDIVRTLSTLASVYTIQRRHGEAVTLYRRALAIKEKQLGPDSASLVAHLEILADALRKQTSNEEAVRLFQRALAIMEKARGPEGPGVAVLLDKIVSTYRDMGLYADAEGPARRSLAMIEKNYASDPSRPFELESLRLGLKTLADILAETNRLPESEALYRRALAITEEREGPESAAIPMILSALGGLLRETNRLAEAEPMLRRATDMLQRQRASKDWAPAFNNLALLLAETNRADEAERLYRRGVNIAEQWEYPPLLANILNNFGLLLETTGRLEEAEQLFRRSLSLSEAHFGPDHPAALSPLNNLATLLTAADRLDEAEPFFNRSLAIAEKTLGPDHPRFATRLVNLGAFHLKRDRLADAEPLIRRALAIFEKSGAADGSAAAATLINLAEVMMKTGRMDESEVLLRQALAIREEIYGSDNHETSIVYFNLAVVRFLKGDWAGAVDLHRLSWRGVMRRREGGETGPAKGFFPADARTQRQFALALFRADSRSAAGRDEAFNVAQVALQTEAAEALAQMSARLVKSGAGPLAEAVRERQNLVARRQSEDKRLLGAIGRGDRTTGDALRQTVTETDAEIVRHDAVLAEKFPDYAEIANPQPLTIAQVQALLTPKEALVFFMDLKRFGPLTGETLAWVITRDAVIWRSIPLDTEALSETVTALRCGLDHALWQSDAGAQKCRTVLNTLPAETEVNGQTVRLPPFDLQRAHDLYNALLGPDEETLKDKHLLIVASGPLTTLPFGVLVTQPPASAVPATPDEYREAAWLGVRNPISILPSVPSLKMLRRFAGLTKAKRAYLGIGNPLLDGAQADPAFGSFYRRLAQSARDRQNCLGTGRLRLASMAERSAPAGGVLFSGSHADVEQIRQASPLPETADELCDVGQRLGVAESEILLGDRAREGALKDMSESGRLADYRFLHFATHGVLAGEVRRTTEPGLILTPPANGQQDAALERDDGFLAASEIAMLKLDTDWVILSACNTAGGASEKAEQLSGLARAFFYAGARSLLVSHWAVDSDATVKLVTRAFEALAQDAQLGHAEALRRSMAALIAAGGHEAHPAYWAPFIVVGATGQPIVPAAVADTPGVVVPPLPVRAPAGRSPLAAPRTKQAPLVADWENEVFNR